MAKDKNSIILYTDLIHTLRMLTDVQRGQLMLIIFEYVNDLNPKVKDPILKIVFEPIKQQLKRDLKKYETKKKQWSKAGKASAEARRNSKQRELTPVNGIKQTLTESTVNVNDSVSVNDNNIIVRQEKFKDEVKKFKAQYEDIMLKSFFSYWSEPNKTKTKMRYELQKTWDTKRRLLTWYNRSNETRK